MTKPKTNALEALRALISERQQYEQWMSALESKREGTPPHVFERVQNDYNTRHQRVVDEIKSHAEELQLSISTLSNRLVEVAREEDTRRDALQEAELRATVGEYPPAEWERLKSEAEQALEKIASDRARLDSELGELRSIQKLSEVGSTGSVETVDFGAPASPEPAQSEAAPAAPVAEAKPAEPERVREPEPAESAGSYSAPEKSSAPVSSDSSAREQGHFPLEDAAAASAAVLSSPPPVPTPQPVAQSTSSSESAVAASPASTSRPKSGKTPPFGSAATKKTPERGEQMKTLKCPECGTPNYPTEWYCERCGGELATM